MGQDLTQGTLWHLKSKFSYLQNMKDNSVVNNSLKICEDIISTNNKDMSV